MKRLSWLFIFNLVFLSQTFGQSDSLVEALKSKIDTKDIFVNAKKTRIQKLSKSLKSVSPNDPAQLFDLTNRLYLEYKVFIFDSALYYAQRLSQLADQLKDKKKKEYAKLKIAFTLNSAGLFKETFDSVQLVNSKLLDDSSRIEYYNLMARANNDLGEFDNDHYFFQKYLAAANQYLDSAMMLCPKGSFHYLDISNYKNLLNKRIDDGLADLKILLGFKTLTNHQRAICNHHLGVLYLKSGDTLRALNSFMVSSIYDIQSAVKETTSMTELANLFYLKGDVEKAYLFIKQAMDDAHYYGARQRMARIGTLLPIIAAGRINKSESQKRAWLTYSIMLTLVAIFILVFVVVTLRQYKKLKEADLKITEANASLLEINNRLREADKIKEEYIGYYFTINSDFLDKIESVKKVIDQKITARKFDDLRVLVDGLDLKREREELYKGFDTTFIKLFPDFVNTFNSFFSEENKMVLKDNQVLNTELRIFALIRLGINDTEKIAKILGYSVNTIYAYKTKVKGKSLLPNEEFEARIKQIKTI
jgi:hypothetical protein